MSINASERSSRFHILMLVEVMLCLHSLCLRQSYYWCIRGLAIYRTSYLLLHGPQSRCTRLARMSRYSLVGRCISASLIRCLYPSILPILGRSGQIWYMLVYGFTLKWVNTLPAILIARLQARTRSIWWDVTKILKKIESKFAYLNVKVCTSLLYIAITGNGE
jgi:hypothetical protein